MITLMLMIVRMRMKREPMIPKKAIAKVVAFMAEKDNAPWIDPTNLEPDPYVRLHNEIIQYFMYFGPNQDKDKQGNYF